MIGNPIFHRLQLLVGEKTIEKLKNTRVIIFGVGGVGSWTAEALVRDGIGEITIVDSDEICITNLNRQIQTNVKNVGVSKVLALEERLRSINPRVKINSIQSVYGFETRDQFDLPGYDYIIDAIDSYTNKLDLFEHAWEIGGHLFSSMGAASRMDSTKIRTADLWEARMDPFAKIFRKGLRRRGFKGSFKVVYSEELPIELAKTESVHDGTHSCFCHPEEDEHAEKVDWCSKKLVINGSAVHVTASFGMALAGLVVQDVREKILQA